jgi:DNA repair protein RadC
MKNSDELRYIQAFSRIIGVKEDDAIEYAQRKGLNALVDNATQLLATPAQREKHLAFLDLYRMSSAINTRKPVINSPETASAFFHSVMDNIYDKEAFVVAFLNTKNRVLDHEVVSVGTINSSIVHPREVFRNAIVNKANSVILCHNHPSGDLTPSKEDISITQRLKETGNLLGIRVLDHLIINGVNQHEVYSFQAQGVMEKEEAYNAPTSVLNEETNYIFTKEEDEQRFLDSDVNSYAIYQLKGGEDLRDYRFEGLEKLQRAGLSVEYDNYDLIYTSPLTDFNGDKNHVLNKLYEQFNINHPTDFRGHSLSVSDIIALKINGIVSSYYVDSFGFKEQSHFLPAQNYLETAEKTLEQNYNQIDSIINNKPSVEELEQTVKTVKTGGSISLLDLANAVQAEKKKNSVVEQLKTKPTIEKEKHKKAPQIGAEMER